MQYFTYYVNKKKSHYGILQVKAIKPDNRPGMPV